MLKVLLANVKANRSAGRDTRLKGAWVMAGSGGDRPVAADRCPLFSGGRRDAL